MADSNITASSLAATAGTGSVSVQWAVTNPNEGGLQYLDLALVEVWASASNNRSLGSKIGEAAKGQNTFVHTLEGGTLRYYWVRPKNTSGSYGDWYPLSATAGVSGTAGEVTSIDNGTITDSVITASTFRTAESGARVQIDGDRQQIEIYNASEELVAYLGLAPGTSTTFYASRDDNFQPSIAGQSSSGAGVAGYSNTGNGVEGTSPDGGAGVEGSGVTYAFYASAGIYGPFTGAHDGLLPKKSSVEVGDVLETTGIAARHGISDTLRFVERAATPRSPAAVGVMVSRRPVRADEFDAAGNMTKRGTKFAALPAGATPEMISAFDHVAFNGVGEGQINVCGRNGRIRRGDLLVSSDLPGKAMRQDDDIMRSMTVAKADEDVDLGPDETAQIACIYHCG